MLASVAGDLAAWFAAVGTVGTLVWLVYNFARGERRRRAEHVRAQASKIAYWPELEGDREVRFVVRNTGELPVYEAVLVTSDTLLQRVRNLAIGTLPPGDTRRSVPAEDVTADSDKLRVTLANKPDWFSSGLWFTDGDGLRWVRDPLGGLGQVQARSLKGRQVRVLDAVYELSDDGERAVEVAAIAAGSRMSARVTARHLDQLRRSGLVRIHVERPDETWWRLTGAGAGAARRHRDVPSDF
jgi:hypothetical protein